MDSIYKAEWNYFVTQKTGRLANAISSEPEKAVLLGLRKKLILGVGLDILAPEMPYEIKTKRKYSHKFLKNKKIYITPMLVL